MRYAHESGASHVAGKLFNKKVGLAVGASAAALVVGLGSVYTVPETDRGLMYEWSKLSTKDTSELIRPGLHFKVPFMQTVKLMPVAQQTINLEAENIYTKDSQELNAAIQITYALPEANLVNIARNNPNYHAVLTQTVRQALKDSFGRSEATEIPSTRNKLMQDSTENARTLVDRQLGIHVQNVTMPNYEYNDLFKTSIGKASQMKADAERARQQVEKDKAEADSAREIARGKADAAIQAARGESEGMDLLAKAKANTIDLEGQALKRNPEVKELRLIEAWAQGGSKVPDVLVTGSGNGSAPMPFQSLFPTGPSLRTPAPVAASAPGAR